MSNVRNTLLVLVWHTGHPEEPHIIPHRPAYLSLIHLITIMMLDGNNNLGKDPPTQIITIHDLTAAHEF